MSLLEKAKLITLLKSEFLKGRSALSPHPKAYIADFSLSYYASPIQRIDYSSRVETLVNNELLSRAYHLARGLMRNSEIDFVMEKNGSRAYLQASYLMADESTQNREFRPLLGLQNAYPKYVVSLDPLDHSQLGVRHLNLIRDFLLSDVWEIKGK